jgi:hypothetical protein
MLTHYGIESRTVRQGDLVAKGYRRDHFVEAWERYLTDEDEEGDLPEAAPLLELAGV